MFDVQIVLLALVLVFPKGFSADQGVGRTLSLGYVGHVHDSFGIQVSTL